MINIEPYNHFCPLWGHQASPFTEEELDNILFLEKILNFDDALVGNSGNQSVEKEIRSCSAASIVHDANTDFLISKIVSLFQSANRDLFMYNDLHMIEEPQYLIYKNQTNDHYEWHRDIFDVNPYQSSVRKISCIIFLSDPEEYEGGELEIYLQPNELTVFKPKKGEIVWFSSWYSHTVKPVTEGIRKTIVVWGHGKR